MPPKPATPCTGDPNCSVLVPGGGACAAHKPDRFRPTAAQRGYSSHWVKIRANFLRRHPYCVDCGQLATIPDHAPETRAQLQARGVPNPDADRYLQGRCQSCHSRKTVAYDGGFGRTRVTPASGEGS